MNQHDSETALLDEILVDAYGDDEQLWALRQAVEDNVPLPADAYLAGEPVSVLRIDYDGNSRRGLTATCRRPSGTTYQVAACDVVFPTGTPGARYMAAYRRWLGLEPAVPPPTPPQRPSHPALDGGPEVGSMAELTVVAPKTQAARCRILGTGDEVTFRTSEASSMMPGERLTIQVRRHWRRGGHRYLSGAIVHRGFDPAALVLVPLRLEGGWLWDPADEYWGEQDEPPPWAEAIIARGPRPAYEMEQVLPGEDPDDPDDDPILAASELAAAGKPTAARQLLVELLAIDARCLDAYAHLGNLCASYAPDEALRYYEAGVRIGDLSLGDRFDGLLPWGMVNNRPYLRCMHGLGLCQWRLGHNEQAIAVFERMLWVNPSDNQGVRSLLPLAQAGQPWTD